MTQILDAENVAQYLAETPDFFAEQPELLSQLKLTSPILGRAISLQERQMEILREKIRAGEMRLMELVRHAEANADNVRRLLQWSCQLLTTPVTDERPRTIVDGLSKTFDIPYATLRLWHPALREPEPWYARDVSADTKLFTEGLIKPYCGINNDFQAVRWLQNSSIRSLAMIRLRIAATDTTFGLLVLASPEPERFAATMATDFLVDIGDSVSAALEPLVHHS